MGTNKAISTILGKLSKKHSVANDLVEQAKSILDAYAITALDESGEKIAKSSLVSKEEQSFARQKVLQLFQKTVREKPAQDLVNRMKHEGIFNDALERGFRAVLFSLIDGVNTEVLNLSVVGAIFSDVAKILTHDEKKYAVGARLLEEVTTVPREVLFIIEQVFPITGYTKVNSMLEFKPVSVVKKSRTIPVIKTTVEPTAATVNEVAAAA